MRYIVVFLVAGLGAVAPIYADVSVSFDAGTTNITTALTGFATQGNMMDGMAITALFSNGFQETKAWADTGANSGGVTGTGWSLNESGDTFSSPWTLANNSGLGLVGLLIDAGPGNTVLDTTFGGTFGTDGSANGTTFAVTSGLQMTDTIRATYRDLVAVGGPGAVPVGDLFRRLDVAFLNGGFGSGRSLGFVADTDNILFAGDINPVPAPGAALLAAIGLGIVSRVRRRMA